MKKSILTLVAMMVLGTAATTAQTADKQQEATAVQSAKAMHEGCPKEQMGQCIGDKGPQDKRCHRHAKPGFKGGKGHRCFKGKGHRCFKHGKGHKKSMRRMAMPVKSTPKCKCATCVELRKYEALNQKIDSLRKEKRKMHQKAIQQTDSLRKMHQQKG